jgi:hypothetical protein
MHALKTSTAMPQLTTVVAPITVVLASMATVLSIRAHFVSYAGLKILVIQMWIAVLQFQIQHVPVMDGAFALMSTCIHQT